MLDDLDRRLLGLLREDSRQSSRKLAKFLGVSAPTVASRVRRLEQMGVIRGYTVTLSTDAGGTRPRRVPKRIDVPCAYCKRPLFEEVRVRLGDREYYVCCPSCEELMKRKYDRLAGPTR
ncbi:MAG TPA: Lrp/AsnC family transcriptional regulator [Thermoplasmata archaeon]|nr:Lrp/AsnC family transcriptional regulator [Thermoplasmata archaeon]